MAERRKPGNNAQGVPKNSGRERCQLKQPARTSLQNTAIGRMRMHISIKLKSAVVALASSALAATPGAIAQDGKLPQTLTFTAYDTGTSGFNIAVAVGKTFKDQHNTDLRVLPAGNDVARLTPIKNGRAQVSAMGVGTYFAQEGVLEFATRDWGPQALQLLLSSVDCNGANLGIAKDTGVTEL